MTLNDDGGDVGPPTQFWTAFDQIALARRYPKPQRLTAMHSGKSVALSSVNAQTVAVQWDTNELPGQGWLFQWRDRVGTEDFYTIESAWPGGEQKCLDVKWGSQSPGTPVWLWPCTGDPAQQWTRNYAGQNTNGYTLRARHSNQCMTVAWTSQSNGAYIMQYPCEGAETQIWGLNFRPATAPEPVDPCVPGERSLCEYDPEVRRVVCECLPG